jgi:hypothetical protein
MFNKTNIAIVFFILGAFTFAQTSYAARASTPIKNPKPAVWGCTLELTEVKAGINEGLEGRSWTVSAEQADSMEGTINVRGKHTLIVDISYDATHFEIKYKDSVNLNKNTDEDGVDIIHPFANSWMKNLRNDTLNILKKKCK